MTFFALDVSRNMTMAARMEALSTLRDFISRMRSGDRICITYFDTSYLVHGDPINIDDAEAIEEMMGIVEQNLRTASLRGEYGSYLVPFQVTEALINNYVDDIGNENALFILSNDTDIIFAANYYNDMSYRMANANFVASFVMMGNKGEGDWQYGWRYAQVLGATYYSYANRVHFPGQFFASRAQTSGWDMDEDGDGVPDFLEMQGIMASNGRIYYSDPNNGDSDGDTISDQEEIGVIYELSRAISPQNISIKLNNYVVYSSSTSVIEPSSQFYFLHEMMNKVEPGKTILVCVSISNPDLPDSDHDGRNDGEDKNPYTFYDPATYNNSAAVQYAYDWAFLNGFYEFGRYNFTTNYNHDFPFYNSSDCANFSSQCVHAGGMPMNELWHVYDEGGLIFSNWDVTLSWSHVQEQYDYFVVSDYCSREVIITSQDIEDGRLPEIIAQYNIQAGDMLLMDAYSDGTMNHSTIISSIDENMIYYAAHSESRLDKALVDALGGDVDTYIFHVLQLRG